MVEYNNLSVKLVVVTSYTDVKKPQKPWGERVFDILNYSVLSCFAFITFLPFWYVFVVSISSYKAYLGNKFLLIPQGITFHSYLAILQEPTIYKSFFLTIFIVIASTFLHLLITAITAYPLSRKQLRGKNAILLFVLITMLFSGGLIPYYLVIKELGLMNNVIVYIIPGVFSGFNMILMLNFFKQIPDELEEAAKIDGAGDLYILFKLFIPLSMPIISTIALFHGVRKWNDWFTAMLFVSKADLYPVQNVLRQMIVEGNMDTIGKGIFQNKEFTLFVSIKMAVIVFSTLPSRLPVFAEAFR